MGKALTCSSMMEAPRNVEKNASQLKAQDALICGPIGDGNFVKSDAAIQEFKIRAFIFCGKIF